MIIKDTRDHNDRTCTCDKCFYCFTRPENFIHNKSRVKLSPLEIHLSEYVGPETAPPKITNHKNRLAAISVKICVDPMMGVTEKL